MNCDGEIASSRPNAHCSLRSVQSHSHMQAHVQISLCVQFITQREIIVFSILLFLYISLNEKFFIEDYIQEI